MAASSPEILIIDMVKPMLSLMQICQFDLRQQLSPSKQSYPVANLLDLVQMMGRKQDGQSLFPAQLPDQIHKFLHTGRIYPGSRFIQNNYFRAFLSAHRPIRGVDASLWNIYRPFYPLPSPILSDQATALLSHALLSSGYH